MSKHADLSRSRAVLIPPKANKERKCQATTEGFLQMPSRSFGRILLVPWSKYYSRLSAKVDASLFSPAEILVAQELGLNNFTMKSPKENCLQKYNSVD